MRVWPHHEGEQDFCWELAVPGAPHRRECVESLIKSVKQDLGVMNPEMGAQSYKERVNTFCEICHLLNCRPLVNDFKPGEVLPSDGNWVLHPYRDYAEHLGNPGFVKTALRGTKIFWDVWANHVPKLLFEYHKWDKDIGNPQIGDKVLVIKRAMAIIARHANFERKG